MSKLLGYRNISELVERNTFLPRKVLCDSTHRGHKPQGELAHCESLLVHSHRRYLLFLNLLNDSEAVNKPMSNRSAKSDNGWKFAKGNARACGFGFTDLQRDAPASLCNCLSVDANRERHQCDKSWGHGDKAPEEYVGKPRAVEARAPSHNALIPGASATPKSTRNRPKSRSAQSSALSEPGKKRSRKRSGCVSEAQDFPRPMQRLDRIHVTRSFC